MRYYSGKRTMEEIKDRVLKVVSAYDKVTSDKVILCNKQNRINIFFFLFSDRGAITGNGKLHATILQNLHCH